MAPLRIDPNVAFLAVDKERNVLPQRLVPELQHVVVESLLVEEVILLQVQEDVDQSSECSCLKQVESCLVSQHREV